MKPLMIFKGALSGRFYATRSYRIVDSSKGMLECTGKKEDVTDQVSGILGSLPIIGYVYERARARNKETGEYSDWGPQQFSFNEPCVPEGSIRNLTAVVSNKIQGE